MVLINGGNVDKIFHTNRLFVSLLIICTVTVVIIPIIVFVLTFHFLLEFQMKTMYVMFSLLLLGFIPSIICSICLIKQIRYYKSVEITVNNDFIIKESLSEKIELPYKGILTINSKNSYICLRARECRLSLN